MWRFFSLSKRTIFRDIRKFAATQHIFRVHWRPAMPAILFVRIESALDSEELLVRARERLPQFRKVPGLVQKIYGKDPVTGDVCGIYFFDTRQALAAFRDSDLAKTIPDAYEASEVRRETFDVLFPLHPERGPLRQEHLRPSENGSS
jgi:hypothetical protein